MIYDKNKSHKNILKYSTIKKKRILNIGEFIKMYTHNINIYF